MALDLLSCIKSFITVMETGSFVAAARETETPAPIVTKQIQKLEAYLGKKLLLRTTRRLELTEEGVVYLEYAKKILAQLDAAKEAVEQTDEPSGKITISGLGMSIMLINQYLEEFLLQYPKVGLYAKYDNDPFSVLQNNADIAFSNALVEEPRLIREAIGSYESSLYASPKYLKKYGTPKIVADLAHHNCLHHIRYFPINEWYFLDGQKITFQSNYGADLMVCLVDAASKNLGIVNTPYMSMVERHMRQGNLIEIKLESKPMPYIYYAYYKPALPQSKVRLLMQFLSKKNATRHLKD